MRILIVGIFAIALSGCNSGFQSANLASSDTSLMSAPLCTPNAHQSCQALNGTGSQTCNRSGSAWGACGDITSCNSGFNLQNGMCVANVCSPNLQQSCQTSNGTGLQTCNSAGSAWGACGGLTSCNSGYNLQNGACVANVCTPTETKVCQTGNGSGSQTCNSSGSAWTTCGNLTSCNSGYNLQNGVCIANTCSPNSQTACQINNGTGSQTCNSVGSAWGTCGNLTSCNVGYYLQNAACSVATWPQNPPLTIKQTAPLVRSASLDFGAVVNALQSSHGNSWAQFNIKATNGFNLDVLDIIETKDQTYPYLSVSHSYAYPQPGGCVNLAWSNDLKNWNWIRALDCNNSSQATIRKLIDGSYLLAYEYNPQSNGAYVKVRYYSDIGSLLVNSYSNESFAPRTPGALNDGTPSFRQINYQSGGFSALQFEMPHHFCAASSCIDQEGFTTWNWPNTDPGPWNLNNNWMNSVIPVNPLIKGLGANGNIGGRDSFEIGGHRYFIVEGQAVPNDWSSWSLYLIQEDTRQIVKLNIQTPSGSRSMGNPKISFITLPSGQAALVGSTFIFSEQPGGTASDAGSHLFVYPFN